MCKSYFLIALSSMFIASVLRSSECMRYERWPEDRQAILGLKLKETDPATGLIMYSRPLDQEVEDKLYSIMIKYTNGKPLMPAGCGLIFPHASVFVCYTNGDIIRAVQHYDRLRYEACSSNGSAVLRKTTIYQEWLNFKIHWLANLKRARNDKFFDSYEWFFIMQGIAPPPLRISRMQLFVSDRYEFTDYKKRRTHAYEPENIKMYLEIGESYILDHAYLALLLKNLPLPDTFTGQN